MESSDALAARIEATRGELSDNLDELSQRVTEAASWRVQYERHTALFLGAAVVAGLLLAAVSGSRGRSSGARQFVAQRIRPAQVRSAPAKGAHLWSYVKDAVSTVVGSQVYSWLRDAIPERAATVEERAATREGLRAASNGHSSAARSEI